MDKTDTSIVKHEAMFMGLDGAGEGRSPIPQYPCWLYHEFKEPVIVSDSVAEANARADGYDSITAKAMANRQLTNWHWDLEDMSVKQLSVFAKEEYGVDLPTAAGQEHLFRCVTELIRHAPQNRNRLILMAHTIKMNYDETLEEIRRMMTGPQDVEIEHFSMEFVA